jgi:hypothetical protein
MSARTSPFPIVAAARGAWMMRALCLSTLLALCGCFSPDQPECSFRCDDSVGNGHHCPENYTCQIEVGFCRLNGSSASCGVDLSMPDAAMAPDLLPGADMTSSD